MTKSSKQSWGSIKVQRRRWQTQAFDITERLEWNDWISWLYFCRPLHLRCFAWCRLNPSNLILTIFFETENEGNAAKEETFESLRVHSILFKIRKTTCDSLENNELGMQEHFMSNTLGFITTWLTRVHDLIVYAIYGQLQPFVLSAHLTFLDEWFWDVKKWERNVLTSSAFVTVNNNGTSVSLTYNSLIGSQNEEIFG